MSETILQLFEARIEAGSLCELDRLRSERDRLAQGLDSALAAALGGFASDRLGLAFLAGYAAALARLFELPPGGELAALCVTEAGGAHPRAIATTVAREGTQLVLRGEKTFVTGGTLARRLLVLAVREDRADPSGLRTFSLVDLDAGRPGVHVRELPATPFVPEVPHAAVRFEAVSLGEDDLRPGDGYVRYVKPFRTIEDLHIGAAAAGYLLSVAWRHGWPTEWVWVFAGQVERWSALARELDQPLDPALHLRLAGALAAQAALLRDSAPLWSRVTSDERARFERDRALFSVAGAARAKRTAKALEALGLPPGRA